MRSIYSFLRSWTAAILALTIVLFGGWIGDKLGRLEGEFFPVVNQLQITRSAPWGEFSTVIEGRFYIARDCNFKNIEFMVGPPGSGVVIPLDFLEKAKKRGIGWHDFGPWVVGVTEYDFQRMVYSETAHDCHFGFETITKFYP